MQPFRQFPTLKSSYNKYYIMKRIIFLLIIVLGIVLDVQQSSAQGFSIPAKKWGIGFGNLPTYTGIRLNTIDKDVELIKGINITGWITDDFEGQTGSFYGLGIGLPMAMGTENRYGVSVGLFATGAVEDVWGINISGLATGGNNVYGVNIAGLATGAGENIAGINIGGLAVGSGNNVYGINIGGLAVGSGNNVAGLNISAMAVGAGNNVSGITVGVLAAGAGSKMKGFNLGGLAIGAGEDLIGINIGGLAVGAGEKVLGLNMSVIAVGAGETLAGINIAGIALGAPKVKGFSLAAAVGGSQVTGVIIAPVYFTVRGSGFDDLDNEPIMTGLSISAFNHIQGIQKGVTIGIFNYAHKVKGIQIGLLNYNRNNPKGLRLLPIFNTEFRKKG